MQEVELHGLQARSDLNGKRGRVRPAVGRGAPSAQPAAGRVAVRLAGTGQEVAVRRENTRSPHATGTAAAVATAASSDAARSAAAAAAPQKQSQRRQLILELWSSFWSCLRLSSSSGSRPPAWSTSI